MSDPFDGILNSSDSAPVFHDFDGDGDLDLVMGEDNGILNYYENTGTVLSPNYTERTGADNPFNGIDIGISSAPTFADIDGDGDQDLLIGERFGALNYYENTGTTPGPVHSDRTGAANPFNTASVGFASSPTIADIDGDGDLDMLTGVSDGSLIYFENTGTVLAPVYTERTGAANPFDGIDIGQNSAPEFADLDGDDDQDLVIGESDGTFNYYENTGTTVAPVYAERTGAANPFDGIDVGDWSAPSLVDLDGDGDLDLVSGISIGTLVYYENTGSAAAPAYTERTGAANPFDGIDIGVNNQPSFVDIDGDGDLDLVIGEGDGNLNYYENTGTDLAPVFTERTGVANPFDGIDIGANSAPEFADLDGDGDLDLVLGEWDPNLNYYENTGISKVQNFAERTGATNPFNGIDIGANSTPTFADIDGDGDLDLVIGESNGNLNYYENTGTNVAPAHTERTGAANPINGIDIGSLSNPELVDLDSDGDLDLVIGEFGGILNYYENTGTSIAPTYTERTGGANPFDGIDIGTYSAPRFVDLDGDGDQDLVMGRIDGALSFYENTGTAIAPVYTERTGAANPFDGFDVGSNSKPSFLDVDGDGDLDLVIGEYNGNLNYYENTGTALTPEYVERTGALNPFDGIVIGVHSVPEFADIDGDGDEDLVIGETTGNLNYYENTGPGLGFVLKVTAHADPSAGTDVMNGTSGADTIDSLGGNDIVRGHGGNDNLTGGTGDDTMHGNDGEDFLYGNAGVDRLYGGADGDRMWGAGEVDYLYGEEGDDFLYGEAGVDRIYGHAGVDRLYGGSEVDYLYGGDDDDYLYGDTGNDRMYGEGGNDRMWGGDDTDYLYGGDDDDFLYGEAGVDRMYGQLGVDRLYGGSEVDYLYGGDGNDFLYGDTGNDRMYGDAGDDRLYGEDGVDYLYGRADNDYLYGGLGNDRVYGDDGIDRLYGQDGVDFLYGGVGGDYLYGGENNDRLYGQDDVDRLYGENGVDFLYGGAGDDLLFGGAGNDRLFGQNDGDILDGQAGADVLLGGTGSDRFVFALGYEGDSVNDYEDDIDTIQVNDNLWTGVKTVSDVLSQYGTQVGNHFVLDFGGGDVLTVLNATEAQLLNDFDIV